MRQSFGLPDAALVKCARAGDLDAYAVLVERYRLEFARYAVSMCGDRDLAVDAMQEAFISVYESLSSCPDPGKFRSWFFKVLSDECEKVRTQHSRDVSLRGMRAVASDRPVAENGQTSLRSAIRSGLTNLTREQREAFVLKHVDGRSYLEMSRLLEAPEDVLKARVHRARERLQQRLRSVV